jgi:ATP-dependent helicase HrpB
MTDPVGVLPMRLPIDDVLPQLIAALRTRNGAVLVAPPGAGKTTRVPLVLAAEEWAKEKKIIVLEPRRLAARAAAARMAAMLGEEVGATVGYRVRFGSKTSGKTRIEVVTEGIFTRLVLADASLREIAAVLFDEFHERLLDGDLGLALARDVQQGLREDLKLVVMSATLDGGRVARLLGDIPLIETAGRSFPVETRYVGRDARTPIERQVADIVMRALRSDAGSLLVFLPGAAEIRRTEGIMRERIRDPTIDLAPLHGALEAEKQDRAIRSAAPGRRKVVLATSIAETSLTIEGVRVVVDCGLARVPRFEPGVGLTRLETVRVSRAAADQRRGRAGRIEPGVCYRLWDEAQTASLAAAEKPQILAADLSGFMLDLAQWGVVDPARLPSSINPRRRRCCRHAHCCATWLPSGRMAASPTRDGGCDNCLCRPGSPAWWSTRPASARPRTQRRSRCCLANAASGAPTSTSPFASKLGAAICRGAPSKRERWRTDGPTW